MKGYVLSRTGSSRVLKLQDIPEPVPGPREVKIKVQAIGMNYAEILSRRGQYSWAPKRPYVPGMETTGEVVEVGTEVSQVNVGDRVIAGAQYGGYAEFHVVPEHLAFKVPEDYDYTIEESAAFLVNYMTSWVALKRLARIQSNDTLLVHAAAGGVGTAAIQLGSKMGAIVVGTASQEEKLDLIRQLGADLAINYHKEDFLETVRDQYGGVDIVLEVVGGEVYRKSLLALNPFGRVIVAGYASIPFSKWNPWSWYKTWTDAPRVHMMRMARGSYGVGATHIGYLTELKNVALAEWGALLEFVLSHQIRPHIGRVFAFDELSRAHDWIESRASMGKVVVKLTD